MNFFKKNKYYQVEEILKKPVWAPFNLRFQLLHISYKAFRMLIWVMKELPTAKISIYSFLRRYFVLFSFTLKPKRKLIVKKNRPKKGRKTITMCDDKYLMPNMKWLIAIATEIKFHFGFYIFLSSSGWSFSFNTFLYPFSFSILCERKSN